MKLSATERQTIGLNDNQIDALVSIASYGTYFGGPSTVASLKKRGLVVREKYRLGLTERGKETLALARRVLGLD